MAAYWSNESVTIFTAVAYFRKTKEGAIEHSSFAVISYEMSRDISTIYKLTILSSIFWRKWQQLRKFTTRVMGHRHSSKTGVILPLFYSTPMILLTQRGAFLRLCMERKHATVSVLKLNELGGEPTSKGRMSSTALRSSMPLPRESVERSMSCIFKKTKLGS